MSSSPHPWPQVEKLTSELASAQAEATALEARVRGLKEDLAASHAARAADIQSQVGLLQVRPAQPCVRAPCFQCGLLGALACLAWPSAWPSPCHASVGCPHAIACGPRG